MNEKCKFLSKFREYIVPKGADIRVCAFNILATCGIIVSLITGFYNLAEGFGVVSFIECMIGVAISQGLMMYTKKTGNFRWAMILTVGCVFIGLFTFLFITNGGYKSGIPFFFVFAVVFTAFLLDGKIMPILVVVELVWYTFLCFYTYFKPLKPCPTSEGIYFVLDIVVCETIVSAILAVAMYFQMHLYRKNQEELNQAIIVAEEANKAKSELLAKMSHDIRTPLNMIMAMNEMIVSNTSSAQIREWVNDSNVSGQILLSLIDDMLDLTRIEAGRLALLDQTWDTEFFFIETSRTWKLQAEKSGLKFNFDIDDSVPQYLVGDEGVIRKIANNLLSNSVKYTKRGTVTLKVRYDGNLKMVVSDTGVGIAPEYLEKIFKPFERGIQEIYRETSGSGLGLAIVKELVDAMGGTIECESVLNEGTTFTVSMSTKLCKSFYSVLDFSLAL